MCRTGRKSTLLRIGCRHDTPPRNGCCGVTESYAWGNGAPLCKKSCLTDALGTGALKVGIDSRGLIPEGGGAGTIARTIGDFNGYRGIHGAKDTFKTGVEIAKCQQ